MPRKMFGLVGFVVAAAMALGGCSNATTDSDNSTTTTPTIVSTTPVGPVGVKPVEGEPRDVVPKAESTPDNFLWKCPDNTDEITVDVANPTARYNDTLITFEETTNGAEPPYHGVGPAQVAVTIQFSGELLAAKAMIVRSSNGYLYYGEPTTPLDTPEYRTSFQVDDDQVVALTPVMLAQGMRLLTSNFVFPAYHIAEVSLCAARS